jgi:hypothetical protein
MLGYILDCHSMSFFLGLPSNCLLQVLYQLLVLVKLMLNYMQNQKLEKDFDKSFIQSLPLILVFTNSFC